MSSHKYTPEQRKFIEKHIKGTHVHELVNLFNVKFGTDLSCSSMKSYCGNHGLRNGVNCRFIPGQVPFNKGKRGYMRANKTSFKPGQRPRNYRPVGSERVNKDGYIEVKVADPKTWRPKHLLVWEAANGKICKGEAIIFADGNKCNITLSNLVKVSRAELLYLNRHGLIKEEAELTKTCAAIAKLVVKTHQIKKEKTT